MNNLSDNTNVSNNSPTSTDVNPVEEAEIIDVVEIETDSRQDAKSKPPLWKRWRSSSSSISGSSPGLIAKILAKFDNFLWFLLKAILFGIVAALFGIGTTLVLRDRLEPNTEISETSTQLSAFEQQLGNVIAATNSLENRLQESIEKQLDLNEVPNQILTLEKSQSVSVDILSQKILEIESQLEQLAEQQINISTQNHELQTSVATQNHELQLSIASMIERIEYLEAEPLGEPVDIIEAPPANRDELTLVLDTGFDSSVQSDAIDSNTQTLDVLTKKLTMLESQLSEFTVQLPVDDSRIEVIERELAKGQAQQLTIMDRISGTEKQIADIESLSKNRLSSHSAALLGLSVAADSGASYAVLLNDLDIEIDQIPEVLIQNADSGIGTRAELQQSFDEYARDALRSPIGIDKNGTITGGLRNFASSLVQVRPLTPQEGNSVGAILSRAKSQLNKGEIGATLSILEELPKNAQDSMADWLIAAHIRVEVLDVINQLAVLDSSN